MHPSHLGRGQWLSEEILQWAGLDVTILRMAAVFHENLPLLSTQSVRHESVIRNCFAEQPVSWLNALDAAEFCVAALLRPKLFADAPVRYLPGPESSTSTRPPRCSATCLAGRSASSRSTEKPGRRN
ncbi:hypothetical protein AB0K15_38770 [Amycolatopsis sp. NPDC049253]|uniref:hypothetical protein n=1 Tax=Amycolatopsis sp. NPDC049253 TaxID=3155274 RepID=UPI003425FCA6